MFDVSKTMLGAPAAEHMWGAQLLTLATKATQVPAVKPCCPVTDVNWAVLKGTNVPVLS